MEHIKDYFFCAMTASVIIGLAENIVNERMKVFIRFISGLFIILLLAFPVLNMIKTFTEEMIDITNVEYRTDPAGTLPQSGIINEMSYTLEESVKEYVSHFSGIDEDDIEVQVITDGSDINNIVIEKIIVTVSVKCSSTSIERAVFSRYEIQTEVISPAEQRKDGGMN